MWLLSINICSVSYGTLWSILVKIFWLIRGTRPTEYTLVVFSEFLAWLERYRRDSTTLTTWWCCYWNYVLIRIFLLFYACLIISVNTWRKRLLSFWWLMTLSVDVLYHLLHAGTRGCSEVENVCRDLIAWKIIFHITSRWNFWRVVWEVTW